MKILIILWGRIGKSVNNGSKLEKKKKKTIKVMKGKGQGIVPD